jgi:hypothetical protein
MCEDMVLLSNVTVYIVSSLIAPTTGISPQFRVYCHMDHFPSNSQRPQSFHPDFDREVFPVVFSVGAIITHDNDQY